MGKKPKMIRDKLKDKIINDIWTLLISGNRRKKRRQKNRKHKERIIKDRIIRDIRKFF